MSSASAALKQEQGQSSPSAANPSSGSAKDSAEKQTNPASGNASLPNDSKAEKRQKKPSAKVKEAQESSRPAPVARRKKSADSSVTHVKPKSTSAGSDKKKASDSEEEAPDAEGSDEGSHSQAWDKDGTSGKNDSVSEVESDVSSEGALSESDSIEDELSSRLKHIKKAVKKGNRSKDASSTCHRSKNSEHCKAGTFKFKDRYFASLASFQLKFASTAAAGRWGHDLTLPENRELLLLEVAHMSCGKNGVVVDWEMVATVLCKHFGGLRTLFQLKRPVTLERAISIAPIDMWGGMHAVGQQAVAPKKAAAGRPEGATGNHASSPASNGKVCDFCKSISECRHLGHSANDC